MSMRFVKRVLGWSIPAEHREPVWRELDELHARRVGRRGRLLAGLWLLRQAASFGWRLRVERMREMMRGIGGLRHDVGYSLRTLLRSPGYLMASVLTLGIGTGAVATVYSVADWVLLRDVPGVEAPEGLVQLRLESAEDRWGPASWGVMQNDLERMRERIAALEGLEGAELHSVHLAMDDDSEPLRTPAAMVTPGYFDVLGVRPAVGRLFDASEHARGTGPAEIVVSYDLWQREWGGNSRAIGDEVLLNGRPYTIIGVAPDGFKGGELPGDRDVWVTSSAFSDVRPGDAETGLYGTIQLWDQLVGRCRAGATVAQVESAANEAMNWIRETQDGSRHSFLATHFIFSAYDGIGLDPGVRYQARRTLGILFFGSALLMLLAVANVANLALARASARRQASAVRLALGAGAWRVGREPLIEGGLSGLLGGVLGLGVAVGGGAFFSEARLTTGGASVQGLEISGSVVLFVLFVSAFAGVLSGVIPGLASRHDRPLEALGDRHRSSPGASRVRSLLVAGQVAVSGALVVGAGLLGRTVFELNSIDLGITESAYTFAVDAGLDGRDDNSILETLHRIQTQARTALGTPAVGLTFPNPFTGRRITNSVRLPGAAEDEWSLGSGMWTTGNGFLSAFGIGLLAGEGFEQDLLSTESVTVPVILNLAMAEQLFPGRTPDEMVGQTVLLGYQQTAASVVGVVSNARVFSPSRDSGPIVFQPYDAEWATGTAYFYANSPQEPGSIRAVVAESVRDIDPTLPIFEASTTAERVDALLVDERVAARLGMSLSLIGLLLAALGLYGVLADSVTERTREIGVRSALGANPRELRSSIVRQSLRLVAGGLIVGLPAAWWTTRFVESRLFGVGVLDLPTYAAAVATMVGVGFAASWIPARRATTIPPVEALRDG